MSVKKENIQCNETKETLFVGVGGVGSSIVVKVAERCRGSEADNIRFVTMDTNANDIRKLKNSNATIVSIQTSSTQRVLDYLKNDKDARFKWFPNNTTLYSKSVSEGAGQVRAISRLALNAIIKNGEIQKLYKAIDELFLKDGGELKQALRVVIVSSATGGTGSGIAMIIGMLIREYLHNHYHEKAAIIRGYLVLPGVMDTVITSETEKESQRRNGYATIKEINAFMIKASGFCGVRKELERYKDLHIDVPNISNGVDRLEGLPYDFCFLLDRVDQSQESMQTLEQYKEFAAQSLYEQNIGPMQGDAFSVEDNIIKEFSNGDNLGRNRFGGIGASVLKYPYEEIVEYIAYERAISCIGDSDAAGAWMKYDKAFEREVAEYKKRRAYSSDPAPDRGTVYINKVNEGRSVFDRDVKISVGISTDDIRKMNAEMASRINSYTISLEEYAFNSFENDPKTRSLKQAIKDLKRPKDYESVENPDQVVVDNFENLRNFEEKIKSIAYSSAKMAGKAIFYDAPSIFDESLKPYHLEKVLVGYEGAMHPNAMRYVLYSLKAKFEEEYKKAEFDVNSKNEDLRKFAFGANLTNVFNVPGVSGDEEIGDLDGVVDLVTKKDKMKRGSKAVFDKLNALFPNYAKNLLEYCDICLKEGIYEIAKDYVTQLCEEFERFYSSFATKVLLLERAQDDIVEKLKFKEGNSVSYVCADRDCLERFATVCPQNGNQLMLPSKLNGKIFEAVKQNAENVRIAVYDPSLAKPRADIFDTVLIDYYKEAVSEENDELLNINIISAISQELRFKEYIKAAKAQEGETVFEPEISDSRKSEYLRSRIKLGYNLAAPGIGYSNFSEPRTINLCAYNSKLDQLRDVNIPALVQPLSIAPRGTDTVSKYELRFFNALYNITPDMLSRFRSPEECKDDAQYNEEPGIYYKAYHDYIKKIGPDSTKSASISLHIDKRWDSLTEMPEISMKAHYKEMVKIHSALIYGIIHGMILTHPSSRYDAQKRIFALEDNEGDRTALIVSNETECDEFYEVLDALYRDRASVEKIYVMQKDRCTYDIDSNRRYTESAFVKDIEDFRIGDGHPAPTSVFEIPLCYYNSLPRSKMDDNELSIMIDSVISVLEKEISKYEQEADRAPILASKLEEQFRLFITNFNKDEYNQNDEMRKNTEITDNRVVNMVFKKVSNKLKKLNSYRCNETISELKALIK